MLDVGDMVRVEKRRKGIWPKSPKGLAFYLLVKGKGTRPFSKITGKRKVFPKEKGGGKVGWETKLG